MVHSGDMIDFHFQVRDALGDGRVPSSSIAMDIEFHLDSPLYWRIFIDSTMNKTCGHSTILLSSCHGD